MFTLFPTDHKLILLKYTSNKQEFTNSLKMLPKNSRTWSIASKIKLKSFYLFKQSSVIQ